MSGPRVSICVPAYNASEWIGDSIDSALAQTFSDFELVVVDNASEDHTAEVVRGYDDSRIRLFENARNLGQAENSNVAVRHARAELVKFLHADDRLEPDCLAGLVAPLDRHERVGFAFCRRKIELAEPDDPSARAWREANSMVHFGFGPIDEVNDGRSLLERYVAAGLWANWIGEPSCVLVRRRCLHEVGGFSRRIKAIIDVDLWVRLLARYDVAFVDQELCTYRFGGAETRKIVDTRHDWLDRLWLLEGLRTFPDLDETYPQLTALLSSERRLVAGTLRHLALSGRLSVARLAEAGAYASWVARRALGRAPPLWGSVP